MKERSHFDRFDSSEYSLERKGWGKPENPDEAIRFAKEAMEFAYQNFDPRTGVFTSEEQSVKDNADYYADAALRLLGDAEEVQRAGQLPEEWYQVNNEALWFLDKLNEAKQPKQETEQEYREAA